MYYFKSVSFALVFTISFLFTSCSESLTHNKTIYLVRHAEKDLTDTTANPALTVEGIERADELAKLLDTASITAFYSTKYQRNVNTLQPLANKKEIQVYEWHDWEPMVEIIKKSTDQSIIICGHGDNLMPMITALGGVKPMEELGHEEYDNLFKVTRSKDQVKVEVIKF